MPRVVLVNPNTNKATTSAMVEIAQHSSPPHFTIEGMTVDAGVDLIADPEALAEAARAVVALAPQLQLFDAVIVGAFGDPGREALSRLLEKIPVVGIGEASMTEAASISGGRFSIATTTPKLKDSIRGVAASCGCGAALLSVRTPEGLGGDDDAKDVDHSATMALMADPHATEEALATLIHQATQIDGAKAVIIGGGPLARAARALAPRFPKSTIIEPIPAAVARVARLLGG